MKELENETDNLWVEFLQNVSVRCNITSEHATHVLNTWCWIRNNGGHNLPTPIVNITDDESVQFCWNYSTIILEIEVSIEGQIMWFTLDRQNKIYDSNHTESSIEDLQNTNLKINFDKVAKR